MRVSNQRMQQGPSFFILLIYIFCFSSTTASPSCDCDLDSITIWTNLQLTFPCCCSFANCWSESSNRSWWSTSVKRCPLEGTSDFLLFRDWKWDLKKNKKINYYPIIDSTVGRICVNFCNWYLNNANRRGKRKPSWVLRAVAADRIRQRVGKKSTRHWRPLDYCCRCQCWHCCRPSRSHWEWYRPSRDWANRWATNQAKTSFRTRCCRCRKERSPGCSMRHSC